MDLNDIRSLVTLLSFVLFLALVRRVWSRRRRDGFDAAARIPFEGDAP